MRTDGRTWGSSLLLLAILRTHQIRKMELHKDVVALEVWSSETVFWILGRTSQIGYRLDRSISRPLKLQESKQKKQKCKFNVGHFSCNYMTYSGSGSSVGIATGYGLDGPGIESRWGRDFPHLSRPALGPTQPPVQWVPALSREQRAARAWRWSLSPFYCRGQGRVELYRYSHYGPYGLCRASVAVHGWPLPFLFIRCT
jgi:hypothetical protein